MKQKHSLKPTFKKHKTELLQIYVPNQIVVECDEAEFGAELLDLYFSNRKRSGGENVEKVEFNAKQNHAVIRFAEAAGLIFRIIISRAVLQ